MIDLENETLVPFSKVSGEVPGRIHLSTAHRWRLRGIRGVTLETVLIGGRRFTSKEALSRFFAATTAAANGEAPTACTSKRRKTAIEAAEKELQQAGI